MNSDLEEKVKEWGGFIHISTRCILYSVKETQPEWQTLNQRISDLVRNPDHPIGAKFKAFCQQLVLQYQRKLQTTENVVYGSSRFMTSFNEFYVISEQDLGMNKTYLDDQHNIILSHFYLVSELLSDQFGNRNQMFVRKVECGSRENLLI